MKITIKTILNLFILIPGFAFAQSISENFTVSAVIASSAVMSTNPLAFGEINPGDTNVAAAGGSFTTAVNTPIQPTVVFTPASGSSPYMSSGSSQLAYSLYLPTGGNNGSSGSYGAPNADCPSPGSSNKVITSGTPYSIAAPGNNAAGTYNICAKIVAVPSQIPAGVYQDTVNLALNY